MDLTPEDPFSSPWLLSLTQALIVAGIMVKSYRLFKMDASSIPSVKRALFRTHAFETLVSSMAALLPDSNSLHHPSLSSLLSFMTNPRLHFNHSGPLQVHAVAVFTLRDTAHGIVLAWCLCRLYNRDLGQLLLMPFVEIIVLATSLYRHVTPLSLAFWAGASLFFFLKVSKFLP